MDDITFGKYQALRSMMEDFLTREQFSKQDIVETTVMLRDDLFEEFRITKEDVKGIKGL